MRLDPRRLAADAPTRELRAWLYMAADFGAKLDVDEETGFVTLTVAGRSVTKRGLTMFTFDDLPPSHLRVVPKPAHVRDRPPRERRAAAR